MVAELQQQMQALNEQKRDIDQLYAGGPLGNGRSTDQILGPSHDKNDANQVGLEGMQDQRSLLIQRLMKQLKKNETPPKPSRSGTAGLVPWWLLVVLASSMLAYVFVTQRTTVITTAATAPLVEQSGILGFLNFFAFRTLRSCLAAHPLLNTTVRPGYSIDQVGYLITHGFVARFSADGAAAAFANEHLSCLGPVWEAARLPEANYFVLKAFVMRGNPAPPAGGGQGAERPTPQLGLHRFNAANLRSRHSYVAHKATLLHVEVPADLEGGTFQASHKPAGAAEPVRHAITPVENQASHIRGDALLAGEAFFTGDHEGARHTAVLLEQYLLPSWVLPYADELGFYSDQERFSLQHWPHLRTALGTLFLLVTALHFADHLGDLGLGNWRCNMVALSLTATMLMVTNWGPPGTYP